MNKKILLVDDEINILIGYQRILQKKYDIKLAENAPRALETIEKEGSSLFSVEKSVNIN